MKKFKVLIVDDEKPIRDELKILLQDEERYQVIGEARNGKLAWDFCQKNEPDIVITDIVMPAMDGLELSQAIKEWNPDIQIVLLTMHKDFNYARKAIKYGVKDYLIKGLYSDQELKETLNKVTNTLKNKNKSTIKNELLLLEEGNKIFDFLLNNDTNINIQNKPALPAHLIIFKLDWSTNPNFLSKLELLQWLSNNYNHDYCQFYVITTDEIHFFYQTNNNQQKENNPVNNFAYQLINDIKKAFSRFNLKIIAVNCSLVKSAIDYRSCYRKSKGSLKNIFYIKQSKIIKIKQQQFRPLSHKEISSLSLKFKKHLNIIDQLKNFLYEDLLPYFKSKFIEPDNVRFLFNQWKNDLIEDNLYDNLKYDLYNGDIYTIVSNFLKLCKELKESNQFYERYEIDEAIDFMYNNLEKHITLSDIAEHVGLSSNYLGHLFKEETGENYKDYLTRIRMEKSTELLKNSNLKIYQIAEKVGIPNYRYFSSVFRKNFGKTPTKYRGE